MKKYHLIMLIVFTGFSCVSKHPGEQKPDFISNFVSITDNENKGVKEILRFFGGQCKYSIGTTFSTVTGKTRDFELELSKSDLIEKDSQYIEMNASNMAWLFYKNLKEENSKYSEIRCVLDFRNGNSRKFTFPVNHLKSVASKMPVVEKVAGYIKDKNFNGIKLMLNDELIGTVGKLQIINILPETEARFGPVKGFIPFGFRFYNSQSNKEILHISGELLRDKQSTQIGIDLDPSSNTDEIFLLDYNY
jgi:hypothetical protein